jgi:uncharacterized peroxidase-related enzyme
MMTQFPNALPQEATLEHLFKAFPAGVGPLMALHDAILRAPGPFQIDEREMIAAYVSALNTCAYCFGAHRLMAQAFGLDPDRTETLVKDGPLAAGLSPRWVPLLAYVEKLTKAPEDLIWADARAVYDAGWSEAELDQAIRIAALYAFMNRIVMGAGLTPKAAYAAPRATDLKVRRVSGYTEWAQKAGLLD